MSVATILAEVHICKTQLVYNFYIHLLFPAVCVCVLKVPDTRCLEWRGSGAGAMKGRGQWEGTRTETTHTHNHGTFTSSLSNTFPHSASPGHLLQHTFRLEREKHNHHLACQTAAAVRKTEVRGGWSECWSVSEPLKLSMHTISRQKDKFLVLGKNYTHTLTKAFPQLNFGL